MANARDGVQKVAQEIVDREGAITARALVDAARPKNSPAHVGFEWDDSIAAEEHRLSQARRWLRLITVTVKERKTRMVHVPIQANAGEPAQREGAYKPLSVVVQNQSELELAFEQLIQQQAGIEETIDRIRAEMERQE